MKTCMLHIGDFSAPVLTQSELSSLRPDRGAVINRYVARAHAAPPDN